VAGDVDVHEELVLGQTADEGVAASVASVAPRANAHVLHSYGPQVAVAQVDPTDASLLAEALPSDVTVAPARVTKSARRTLSDTEQLGLAAFELRASDRYAEAKANRPWAGAAWDGAPEASPPGCAELVTAPAPAPSIDAPSHVAAPLSARLSGSVAVGLVIVEGPTTALQFDATERAKVVAETQNGATWLGGRHPVQPVTWRWDIDVIRVDATPDPNAADLEALWRDPAMAALGYGPGLAGVEAYAEELRHQQGSDWAYVTFFTKYPTGWFAYASIGGPRLVMQYDNDGWGPDNIDRVFAHETGHIFNAPDEYASSNCNCGGSWGYYGKPNANCATCASGGGVPCIMKANTWDMCPSTPYHLGFPICPGRLGVQFRGNVAASSTRRWFTHSWPADCHVVWSVVPTTVRAGAAQIRWDVHVERASSGYITYWISITNLTAVPCDVEARYAVLGST
jgi:hypothetical protein